MIQLRPTSAADEAFLYGLFCNAESEKFALLDVPDTQKEQLLHMQFVAKTQQYLHQFPDADFDVVLRDEVPVGSLYALRGPEAYVLIDITLLPEHRSTGIGTELVGELISDARGAGRPLQAHVLKQNRAWGLWQRMGFGILEDDGAYLKIEVPAAGEY